MLTIYVHLVAKCQLFVSVQMSWGLQQIPQVEFEIMNITYFYFYNTVCKRINCPSVAQLVYMKCVIVLLCYYIYFVSIIFDRDDN